MKIKINEFVKTEDDETTYFGVVQKIRNDKVKVKFNDGSTHWCCLNEISKSSKTEMKEFFENISTKFLVVQRTCMNLIKLCDTNEEAEDYIQKELSHNTDYLIYKCDLNVISTTMRTFGLFKNTKFKKMIKK